MQNKRGQVGIEYMIIIGFVTLAVVTILAFAVLYSGRIKDNIRLNQVENFAIQLINSAESVFFAGEPSKTSISLYLPEGVREINITSNNLVITTHTTTGDNVRAFPSNVPLQGSISTTEGIKQLTLEATSTYLFISQ